MAGAIIFLILVIGFIWLLVGLNVKAEKENEAKEVKRKQEAFWEKTHERRAKEMLFKIYIKFGKSWYCNENNYPEYFSKWTRKEPVYSKDGIRIGYNFYITEEGIEMLKEFRGD